MVTSRFAGILLAIGMSVATLGGALIATMKDQECRVHVDPELCIPLVLYIPFWAVLVFAVYMVTGFPAAFVLRRALRRRGLRPGAGTIR